jgi:outer membrane protein assembly factor BamA
MGKLRLAFTLVLLPVAMIGQQPTPYGAFSVSSVALALDSSISSENFEAVSDAIRSYDYRGELSQEVAERARFALQERGYINANLRSEITLQDSQSKTLAVTIAVDQGEQYRLRSILFSREDVPLPSRGTRRLTVLNALPFSEEEHRRQFPIADGDIFDSEKIRQGLANLMNLYTSQGYINFTPIPHTVNDDNGHRVALEVDLDIGAQFRFGKIELVGSGAQPELLRSFVDAWQSRTGQIYDGVFVETRWQEIAPLFGPDARMAQFVDLRQDLSADVVDVKIRRNADQKVEP